MSCCEDSSPSRSTLSDTQLERTSQRRCVAAGAVTPVDAAGIRVLLVPVGRVRATKLAEWTNAIAQFSQLRLCEVLGHADDSLLSGYAAGLESEGALRFAFATDASAEHEHLEGLQTHRQVLGVVGVMDCMLSDDVGAAYDEFLQAISRHTTAVAYRCLAFDLRADQHDDVPGVTVVPDTGRLLFYLQTLLSDFAATMLGALALMARSIEDRADLLSSSASSPASAQLGSPREISPHTADRASESSGQEPLRSPVLGEFMEGRGRFGGEMDRDALAPHLRQSPGSPVLMLPPPAPPAAKEAKLVRNKAGSATSGRLKKLQGDLYLMSGRLTEALAAYSAAMEASMAFHDHLWQAVAVEGYCAALLLLCERSSERRLAHAFVLGIPRGPETTASDSEPGSLGDLLREISELFTQVPVLFEKCHAVAPLLHAEACVRAALVLQVAREALLGECDAEAALDSLLRQHNYLHPRPTPACMARDVVAQTCGAPQRTEISRCLQRGWTGGLATLADQLELLSGIGALYGRIGYSRKTAFFLRQFLLTSVPVLLRASDCGPSSRESPSARSSTAGGEYSALSALPDGAAAFAAASSAAAAMAHLPDGRTGHLPLLAAPPKPARASRSGMHQAIVACLDALSESFARSGWLRLQADGLRGCLALAEALPSYPHAIASAFRLARCLGRLAETAPESQRRALVEEQHAVRSYLLRTIGMLRHADRRRRPPASPPCSPPAVHGPGSVCTGGRDAAIVGGVLDSLLVGLQLCLAPDGSPPIQKDAPPSDGGASLFLYTPSAQTQSDRPLLVAAGEKARFVATLRNPLPFALPLTDVALVAALDSDEGGVDVVPASCTVPAGGQGQLLLEAVPRAAGRLRVAGIRLRLLHDLSIQCLLADEDTLSAAKQVKERPLRQRLDAERAALLSGPGAGQHALPAPAAKLSALSAGYALVATVAPALPRLTLTGSSLASEESLGLYEGESRVVTLALANRSTSIGVDWMEVQFEQLAGSSDGQRGGLVDAAFSYRCSGTKVEPMATLALQVRVDGLPGLTGATVVVRYGSSVAAGWQRELRVPLRMSVVRLLAPVSSPRYLPLPPFIVRALVAGADVGDPATRDMAAALREALAAGEQSPEDLFCLAELDLANTGATDLRMEVEVDLSHGAGEPEAAPPLVRSLRGRVPAHGGTLRLAVPLPRVTLSSAALSTPIPGVEVDGGPDNGLLYPWRTALSSDAAACEQWMGGPSKQARRRQFVISHKGGQRELDEARAVYWYQQALADRVRVRWVCEQSQRHGYLDPRALFALDASSLAAVRPREVQARLLVDGRPVLRAGVQVQQAKCAARKATEIAFALTNTTGADLRAVFSARVVRGPADAGWGDGSQSATHQAAGARGSGPDSVDRLAAADIGLSFVAGLSASADVSETARRFRFRPAVGGLNAPAGLKSSSGAWDARAHQPQPPKPLPASGLVLDDVCEMHLPPLQPRAEYRLALPMYALSPGRYQIEYCVRRLSGAGSADSDSIVHETLVVDSA
ncbi:hypothetical protein LPJ61_000263 [Coemansia biformis]|uniref:Uncharacterized protein n=1 Tax=Coemansia biformis TaxID=1286918 RepID=A0A9W7YC14_9FUNG|nr:hypothetical protein LPJ61_000263 [Coemansia biformis]